MIGNVIGNYKIVDKIGEGGMGAVFRGVDVMLDREVAIKMLRPELANNPQIVNRFRSEAVTLAKLNHPNIAMLYSFLRQGDDYFMVMEFVRGETLDDMVRHRGAMPCEQAVRLFCQALDGIDHAHKLGIIHRDIKPANMMLTTSGSIKVMDFGIARVLGTDRMTKTGHLIGTIEYMSPEQIRGQETGASSDIYSLGILLYEMLTGKVPFSSESEYDLMRSHIEDAPKPPREFAPHIPAPIEQAIMRALAKRPDARYQSAGEFRMTLEKALESVAPGSRSGVTAATTRLAAANDPVMPQSGAGVKETVVGGAGSVMAASAGMKDTRLGSAADAHAAYAPAPQPAQPVQLRAPQAPASLLSNLNWKHYAAAGGAFVVLVTASLAFMTGGGGEASQKNAQPVNSGAIQTPSTSGPSAPPPSQPQLESNTQILPLANQEVPATTDATESSTASRTRGGRSERSGSTTSAATSSTASTTSSAPSKPPSQPAYTPPPQPPAESKPAVAKSEEKSKDDEDKKSKKDKDKEKEKTKKEGVKETLKKVFGFGKKN